MSSATPRLRILLLCDENPRDANTLLDHIRSFRKYSRHRVRTFNPKGVKRTQTLDFKEFDVVVVHWSLSLIHDHYLHGSFRDQLSRFGGLKVHLIQDDYRWVDRMTEEQRRIGINVLFTLVSPEHFDKIWTPRLPGVRLISTLPGYVPQELLERPVKAIRNRERDIVYRGREVPWWLGRLGQEKVLIGRGVRERAAQAGLNADIAWTESDRIYGERWIEFLADSRTTIGCEGGASITDFDGSIESSVNNYLELHPKASFDEVHEAVLAPHEGNVPMNVMTPRLFEAAALKTALVLFPGRYSDVLIPGRHYIPLEKDFSNFETVVHLIRDDEFLAELAQRTYDEVAMSPKYGLRSFIEEFDRVVAEEGVRRAWGLQLGYRVTMAQRRAVEVVRPERVVPALASAMERMSGPAMHLRLARYPRDSMAKGYLATMATFRARGRALALVRSLVPTSRSQQRLSVDTVLEDVLKIDILCQARRGKLTAGHTFQAWPHLHSDGVLELRSALPDEPDADADDAADVISAIEAGAVHTLVWNHSHIAKVVYHALPGKSWVEVALGTDGRHDFPWLQRLLLQNRRAALQIISPALPAGRPTALTEVDRSQTARESLQDSHRRARPALLTQMRKLADDPSGHITRMYVATRVVAFNAGYRSLVRRYMFEPSLRSSAQIADLLGDLVRLDLLRRTCSDPNGFGVSLSQDSASGHWTYMSERSQVRPANPPADQAIMPPARLIWDHSAVSSSLVVPAGFGRTLTVWLGAAGVYEFSSLVRLAQQDPSLVASVLPRPGVC